MLPRIKLWGPVFIWCLFIFYLSSIPHLQVTEDHFWNLITRKAAHIIWYGILGILVNRALSYKKPLLAVILAVLYGASDEFHQTLVPSRTGKYSDIIYDLIGALIGAYCSKPNVWKKLLLQLKKPKN